MGARTGWRHCHSGHHWHHSHRVRIHSAAPRSIPTLRITGLLIMRITTTLRPRGQVEAHVGPILGSRRRRHPGVHLVPVHRVEVDVGHRLGLLQRVESPHVGLRLLLLLVYLVQVKDRGTARIHGANGRIGATTKVWTLCGGGHKRGIIRAAWGTMAFARNHCRRSTRGTRG